MPKQDTCFISFKSSIEGYTLPKRFTFPFCYQPHPLSQLAVKELQDYLTTQNQWQKKLGLEADKTNATGKMFGVLLVKNQQGEIGYLTAFSGKFCGGYNVGKFVPAIPDIKNLEKNIDHEQANINEINHQIILLESNKKLPLLKNEIDSLTQCFKTEVVHYQTLMANNRKYRKEQRQKAEHALIHAQNNNMANQTLAQLLNTLAKQSVQDKNQLKTLKLEWQRKIESIQTQLDVLVNEITQLKNERQQRSSALQHQLFQQYQLLNSHGETKAIQDVFKSTPQKVPPSGSGDCAAPKLIQYAFKHNFTLLAMAEFWWGISPKSEIRQHKNIYPACSGKCEPILKWMLAGIKLDENPLLTNNAQSKKLEILYQDNDMAIVNKPNDLLSVPGKNIEDSVYSRIKQLIPFASGPIIVHRLDMSTSGLMVIALTKRAHKQLQKQFIQRTVEKRYIALLNGKITTPKGEIMLPLLGDFNNRPRQLVCEEKGKQAHTTWQIIEHTSNNQTKVYLTPKTGRTHQLRVHCAHPSGLNTPIVGDDLYGMSANRLHLHAEKITLKHPISKTELTFQSPAEF